MEIEKPFWLELFWQDFDRGYADCDQYEFATQAELDAFLRGVEAAAQRKDAD